MKLTERAINSFEPAGKRQSFSDGRGLELRITPKPTLYRLTSQGKLTKVKISEGRVGWLQSSVDEFIENLKTTHLNNS